MRCSRLRQLKGASPKAGDGADGKTSLGYRWLEAGRGFQVWSLDGLNGGFEEGLAYES